MTLSLSGLIARVGLRRLCIAAAVVIGLLAFAAAVRDPFGLRAAKIDELKRATAAAQSAAQARTLEAEGERASVFRVSEAATTTARAQSATADLSRAAATAGDAEQPLDPARVARLRADDAGLCRITALLGCPAVAAP